MHHIQNTLWFDESAAPIHLGRDLDSNICSAAIDSSACASCNGVDLLDPIHSDPSQVLPFAYPVADRYLFFPSVAAAVLIAWGVMTMGGRLGRPGLIGAVIFLLALGSMWARTTITYVSEWRDPRLVWYGASAKSSDSLVFNNLGREYLDISAGLGKSARKTRPSETDLQRLASAIWKSDPRLPALLSEW